MDCIDLENEMVVRKAKVIGHQGAERPTSSVYLNDHHYDELKLKDTMAIKEREKSMHI